MRIQEDGLNEWRAGSPGKTLRRGRAGILDGGEISCWINELALVTNLNDVPNIRYLGQLNAPALRIDIGGTMRIISVAAGASVSLHTISGYRYVQFYPRARNPLAKREDKWLNFQLGA